MPAPGSVTLASLRLQAQQRADMVNSNFISTSEWNALINSAWKELYDLLIGAYGNDYFMAPALTFQTDGTSALYSLPDGTLYSSAPAFYKLCGVDLSLASAGGSYYTLKPFTFAERNRYTTPFVNGSVGLGNLRYRLQGSKLWFTPTPQAGQTIQLWYIPEPTTLTNDTDAVDFVSGWEEYIVLDAAISALGKEESDTRELSRQKAEMGKRLETMAENRDAGGTYRVADVRPGGTYGNPYADPFGEDY